MTSRRQNLLSLLLLVALACRVQAVEPRQQQHLAMIRVLVGTTELAAHTFPLEGGAVFQQVLDVGIPTAPSFKIAIWTRLTSFATGELDLRVVLSSPNGHPFTDIRRVWNGHGLTLAADVRGQEVTLQLLPVRVHPD